MSDQDAFAAGFWRGANTSPTMVFGHPESFDAGDLGGRVECGEVAAWHTRGTSCLSVDAAAMVFVLDVSNRLDVPTDTALARSVRASVEHRASP